MSKNCTKCNQTKLITEFNLCKSTKDGLQYVCQICARQRAKEWRANNRERHRMSSRKWTEDNQERDKEIRRRWKEVNRDRLLRQKREYREANLEMTKRAIKAWHVAHPERRRHLSALRRTRLRSQTPELSELEKSMITGLYLIARILGNSGGEKYHVDHIRPISKGGTHEWSNLQVITQTDNLRKSDKLGIHN